MKKPKSRLRKLSERCPVCDMGKGIPCEIRMWTAMHGYLPNRTFCKADRPHRIKLKRK